MKVTYADIDCSQRIFNYVIKKLSEQGKRSMKGSVCVYLSDEGLKCAVGHLLPEGSPLLKSEGGIHYLIGDAKLTRDSKMERFLGKYEGLLAHLQDTHDQASCKRGLIAYLAIISSSFGLTFTQEQKDSLNGWEMKR